jgi:hypothetical protein
MTAASSVLLRRGLLLLLLGLLVVVVVQDAAVVVAAAPSSGSAAPLELTDDTVEEKLLGPRASFIMVGFMLYVCVIWVGPWSMHPVSNSSSDSHISSNVLWLFRIPSFMDLSTYFHHLVFFFSLLFFLFLFSFSLYGI